MRPKETRELGDPELDQKEKDLREAQGDFFIHFGQFCVSLAS